MQLMVRERTREFDERHQAIDWLRTERESDTFFTIDPEAVRSLLQEIDLLQIIAHAAEHVAAFPRGEGAAEPLTLLRNSLRRWKE